MTKLVLLWISLFSFNLHPLRYLSGDHQDTKCCLQCPPIERLVSDMQFILEIKKRKKREERSKQGVLGCEMGGKMCCMLSPWRLMSVLGDEDDSVGY